MKEVKARKEQGNKERRRERERKESNEDTRATKAME